ncbi:DUF99 family protein [Polyangium sp. 15x6]|uniref:endonuclease dU n=1 Tax=Polyangium sp. 15x6 TaxID=3042687 RepID=UPI00249B8D9F|nr:DUF99 family protein [Polyangium sp. 15x6]MDI3292123.1 DUF99 family protein [Polyangium sp. 15x6]
MSIFSHVIGVDDAPFPRAHRGDVPIVGVAFAGTRLEGVLSAKVRRDGANATDVLASMISRSRFAAHTRLVMMEGIALAGFNVVDIHDLAARLGMAVLVVSKREPNVPAVRHALLEKVPGGARKWKLVEKAGPMEPCADLFIQRAGLGMDEATAVIRRLAVHGRLPEPVRVAHLVASALAVPGAIGADVVQHD